MTQIGRKILGGIANSERIRYTNTLKTKGVTMLLRANNPDLRFFSIADPS